VLRRPIERAHQLRTLHGWVRHGENVPEEDIAEHPPGGRSAEAVNILADEGGFSRVYSVVDGFESDKDDNGKRTINGWKNSSASWTITLREDYWFRSH